MTAIASAARWARFGFAEGSYQRLLLAGACTGALSAVLIAVLARQLSPITAGLAVAGVGVVCGMMISPTFAVVMLTMSIPFEKLGRLNNNDQVVALSLSRILGVIALASLILHVCLRKKKLRFGTAFWLYTGYTLICFLSYAWANTPEDTFRDMFRVLGNLVFFFIIANVIRSYPMAKTIAIVWLVATIAAGGYSLVDYYYTRSNPISESQMDLTSMRFSTVVSDEGEIRYLGRGVLRMFGPTAHPTLFGVNMTMAVPFFIWAIRTSRGLLRYIWFGGLGITIVCIFLSNTRAVILLIAFVVLYAILRGLWRINAQTAVALLLLTLAAGAVIPKDIYQRALNFSLYTSTKSDSIRVRFKFWAVSWELIQHNWWGGIGVGDQTTVLKMIKDEDTGYLTSEGTRASAHNEFIWVMVEVGIFGYLLHWAFVWYVARSSFRAGKLFRARGNIEPYLFSLACQAVFLGILLFSLQSEVYHYPLKGWWLMAALSCSLYEVARNESLLRQETFSESPS